MPRITDEFHSLDQVGWYGSAFFFDPRLLPIDMGEIIQILCFESCISRFRHGLRIGQFGLWWVILSHLELVASDVSKALHKAVIPW